MPPHRIWPVTGALSFSGAGLSAIPSSEPTQFVGGDTVAWTRALSSYPATDGWTLHYRLLGENVDVVTDDDGNGNTEAAYSLVFAPGDTDQVVTETAARLVGWVSKSSEIHTIFDGIVRILPNVRSATGVADVLTHEERMLSAIQARLEGRTTADVARYGREGTFIDKLAIADLLRMQGIYKAKLWRLENPGAVAPTNVIRFSHAGGGNTAERLAWPGYDA